MGSMRVTHAKRRAGVAIGCNWFWIRHALPARTAVEHSRRPHATSPPQSRKLLLTNGARRGSVSRLLSLLRPRRLTPIAIKAAEPYIHVHSRLSLPLQFRP